MAKFSQRGVFLLTFFGLLSGVMAEVDVTLIGVVVATVCVVLLLFVIIAMLAYCSFRHLERKRRKPIKERKHSGMSTSTAPRWAPSMMPPAMMPVYTVPESMVYGMPQNYYLGHYTPKFLDGEGFEKRKSQTSRRTQHMSRMRENGETYSWRSARDHEEQETQEKKMEVHTDGPQEDVVRTTTLVVESVPMPEQQPNGHVLHEFSQSNYKVIRKQHKHEKMPEWLIKEYAENEKSIDVAEETSIASSDAGSTRELIMSDSIAVPAVRAQVSPRDSTLDSEELLHVSPDYTIVDYVDPEQPNAGDTTTTTYRLTSNDGSTASDGFRVTTTEVTTTTQYSVDTSEGSASTYVPPASTSTPRAPPTFSPPHAPPLPETAANGNSDSDDEHHRMRRGGEGSVENLPKADVQF